MGDLLPPFDEDAERSVISAALLEPLAFDEARRKLASGDFFMQKHQEIWLAIETLRDANRVSDATTVASWLRDCGKLDSVGGTPYIADILDASPAIANVADHAEIVRRKAKMREGISICQKMAANGYEPSTDPQEWLNSMLRQLEEINALERDETLKMADELASDVKESFYERRKSRKKVMGLPTGIRELDELIGGLKRKCLYYIAARPGIGKTGFMTGVCLFLAQLGYAVVVISVEMPSDQLTMRMIAQLAHLDIKQIENGTLADEDLAAFNDACERFRRLPIVVDDADHTIQSVRSTVRRGLFRLRKKFPDVKTLGLIAVDYLQILKAEKDTRTREEAVSRMSAGCKSLAKEFNCPTIALSQLNRAVEERPNKRPKLSDLRESGSIEQDGYGIFFLYRDDYYRPHGEQKDGLAEIIVGKLRQGGETGTVQAQFHGPSTHFTDLFPVLPGTEDDLPI